LARVALNCLTEADDKHCDCIGGIQGKSMFDLNFTLQHVACVCKTGIVVSYRGKKGAENVWVYYRVLH
jgi:hypothetical protein